MHPLGTSIGGGDALPLLALPLKALGPLLPAEFQYLGLWLLLSYTLQGVFGYQLVRTFCPRRWLPLLGALFFLLSPVMIFRAGHIALASHWLILFALWAFFDAARTRPLPRRYARRWLLVVGLSGLVHPYLAAMVVPFALLSLLRESWHEGRLAARTAFALAAGFALLLGLEWWLSGLFGLGRGGGFDLYTLNPNAFMNPLNRSRLLPALPLGPGQYEGFSYLGLGVLALGVPALLLLGVRFARAPRENLKGGVGALRRRGLVPLALLCAGLALFALGNTVVFILEVALLYALLVGLALRLPRLRRFSQPPLRRARVAALILLGVVLTAGVPVVTSTFRAPGRFVWPVVYLLVLGLVVFVLRRFSARTAALLLAAGLALQVADLRVNRPFRADPELFTRNLGDARWPEVVEPFRTIAVIPPFERSVGGLDDFRDFAYLAARSGKRVTAGVLVRIPGELERVAAALVAEALEGPRDPDTLYIFSAESLSGRYRGRLEPGLRCVRLDAYQACWTQAPSTPSAAR